MPIDDDHASDQRTPQSLQLAYANAQLKATRAIVEAIEILLRRPKGSFSDNVIEGSKDNDRGRS